jgi:hypothetical protein
VPGVRLRQVALAAHDLEPVVDALAAVLEVSEEPFVDPGVGEFGLRNAVLAVGDTFIEIVSPGRSDTAAGRYLDRRGGDCGYMAIFQVDDLASARARIADLGIRVVWQSDHADMAGTHLHPKDVPGALVSIDWAAPAGSWRWGGPAWTGQVPALGAGGIISVTVASDRPAALADRWAEVLGRRSAPIHAGAVIELDGGRVCFVEPGDGRSEGICAVEVAVPGGQPREALIGGVRVVVRPIS